MESKDKVESTLNNEPTDDSDSIPSENTNEPHSGSRTNEPTLNNEPTDGRDSMPSESTSELKQLENQAATASSSENTDEPHPENQEANASSSSDPQPGCSYQSLPDVMKMIEGITSDTPPEEITFPVIPESSEESDDEDDVVKEEQVLDESNKFLFCGECGRCFKKENMLKRHKRYKHNIVEMFDPFQKRRRII